MLPEPVICDCEGFAVVRDDMLAGGTKARALPSVLGVASEYVYASPCCGFAQVALAHTAKAGGKRAVIFCAKRAKRHARTIEAEAAGAEIREVPCGYLSVVSARAREYALAASASLLPFGMDTPEVVEAIAEVARGLPVNPSEFWTVAGSGTLTRALQLAWPAAKACAVQVGAKPNCGRAKAFIAPEKFEQDAKLPPPFPSCGNYDAKAWRFIKQHAAPGALFWNVAA